MIIDVNRPKSKAIACIAAEAVQEQLAAEHELWQKYEDVYQEVMSRVKQLEAIMNHVVEQVREPYVDATAISIDYK